MNTITKFNMKNSMKKCNNNYIHGIGNDILEISRFQKAIEKYKDKLIDRIFTKKEQNYCNKFKDPIPHYAARFCAKESIVKALGCGINSNISWKDIEILNDNNKKPYVVLSNSSNKLFNNPKIMISISHCNKYATAVAIWHD